MSAVNAVENFLANHAPVPSGSIIGSDERQLFFPNIRVTAFLGRGGTSEVYRGQFIDKPRDVAVKILTRTDEAAKRRFRQETEFLRRATPCAILPQFFGSGEKDGHPYIVMELLEPLELPSKDKDVARFMVEVADAVAILHRDGIVHRDLKPRNIMRRKDGRIAIIDLGLAHRPEPGGTSFGRADASSCHSHTSAVGTPRFVAPEQLTTDEISPAADIHALGVIANDCFDSQPPSAWKKIIRRATSSLPAQRYRSAEAFARAVRLRHLPRRLRLAAAALAIVTFATTFVLSGTGATLRESIAQLVVLSRAASEQGFALDGATISFSRPLLLEAGTEYRITGPGIIVADIRGEDGATLFLENCVIRNTTQITYPENATRYVLNGGVYLNFISQDAPIDFSQRDFIAPYDGASNFVRFRGPATIKELQEERRRRFMDSLR